MTDEFDPNFTPSIAGIDRPDSTSTQSDSAVVREQALRKLRDSLREGQQQMADWEGGPLAVSAVPGSGKSTGMAAAAAIAIARYRLHSRRQLVVVTFTRSAAANIKVKIRENL
ncbi:MAG TPA: DNA helicase UvrD, partial [Microcoleaceae bacterium UBA11344]|nr:DNA helicase UvrD [Microcoleaceae cyanobacterium UBA11344]